MCTSVLIKSKENNSYIGRTQEFSYDYDYVFATYPKGITVKSASGDFYINNAIMSVNVKGVNLLVDGMNEAGLVATTQYFADYFNYSSKDEIIAAGKKPIFAEEMLLWILGNCKDIPEVIEKVQSVSIMNTGLLGPNPLPQHFMVVDKTGRSVVIEPSSKLAFDIHENEVGVMTNSPKYDWHVDNLKNYTGYTGFPKAPQEIGEAVITPVDNNLNLHGIPGDFTSTSRFVRTSITKSLMETPEDDKAVNATFHVLSSEITKGLRRTENYVPTEPSPTNPFPQKSSHFTEYTVVYDIKKQEVHIKTYDHLNIQSLTFKDEYKTGDKPRHYEISREQPVIQAKEIENMPMIKL